MEDHSSHVAPSLTSEQRAQSNGSELIAEAAALISQPRIARKRALIAMIERLTSEVESLHFVVSCRTLSEEAVSLMRDTCEEGLGFNCAFVDDEMKVLVNLSQRAVLAGLASDAHPATLTRMVAASEKRRAEHEAALGQPFASREAQTENLNTVGTQK